MKRTHMLQFSSMVIALLLMSIMAYSFTVGSSDEGFIYDESSQTSNSTQKPSSIERIQTCVEINYTEYQDVITTCDQQVTVCSDAPLNQSCQIKTQTYDCIDSQVAVPKSRQDCTELGLTIYGKYFVEEKEYKCSAVEDISQTIVLCDSVYDGNGDGICQSGESCLQFKFTMSSSRMSEKNSGDEFVETDQTFFLNTPKLEVTQ